MLLVHVLIIDDELDDRLLAIRELQREFPDLQAEEIVDAEGFEQALVADRFDVAVIDYQLHWNNGLSILSAIKERYPQRPVIMFTDSGSQEVAVEAMKGGLDDYVLKSSRHYMRLSAAVRSALERAEERRKAALLDIRLQSLLNQLNVGVFRVSSDRQLLEGNSTFLRLLGVSSLPEAQISRLVELLSRPEEIPPQRKRERELQLPQANGGLIWILLNETLNAINGETVIDGLVEDITDRKQAEVALSRYARRLETLRELDRSILQARSHVETAQTALKFMSELMHCQLFDVTLFDVEHQRATVLAVVATNGVGFSTGESFSAQEFGDIDRLQQNQTVLIEDLTLHPKSSSLLQQLFEQGIRCLMKVPLIAQGELIGSLNLGAMQPRVFNEEDREIAFEVANELAIAMQQVRLRQELQRYTEQLEQMVSDRTQQLQEANSNLEAFTFSVSHDLREPLRGLQGFAQVLLTDYADQLDPAGRDFISRILRTAERMDSLIQDLLSYSRLTRSDLPLMPINLNGLVMEVLNQLETQLLERQAQVILEEPLLPLVGNYRTLVQVVTNLITNAAKFVASGVQPQIRIRTQKHNEWVRLWIEDNGIGIEPRYHELIFGVFERLHGVETYPGTGIGLAIVRKGVERMGGQAGVESKLGCGSQFWIELPRVEE